MIDRLIERESERKREREREREIGGLVDEAGVTDSRGLGNKS